MAAAPLFDPKQNPERFLVVTDTLESVAWHFPKWARGSVEPRSADKAHCRTQARRSTGGVPKGLELAPLLFLVNTGQLLSGRRVAKLT